jgi:DNA mismatch endonuclease (patch repair protein)
MSKSVSVSARELYGYAALTDGELDRLPIESRSRIMRSIRKTDTKPELIVRRLLHRLGFRFRLHQRHLPGTPDIVLPRHRAAVLVHGCFWHQHEDCRKGAAPSVRHHYWLPKLARNVERDRLARAALEAAGYKVLVIWECTIRDAEALRMSLLNFLSEEGGAGGVAR